MADPAALDATTGGATPVPAGSAAAPSGRTPIGQLLKEMARMMLRHPWLLIATILPNVITPALSPVQAWLTSEVLAHVSKGNAQFRLEELLDYAPLAIGVFLGLGLLRLFEKVSNRMFDDRLLIDLQRQWFDQRGNGCVGEQVARSMNDCKNAVKIFDLMQKELWVVLVGIPAVMIWQVKLSPELLPALLVSAFLPFLCALSFGGLIQRISHHSQRLIGSVSSAIAQGDRSRLHQDQERLYRNRIRFELSKQASEVISEFAFWVALILVLLLSISGVWRLLPPELSAAQIGGFLVNLTLINKPLNAMIKMHNKIRESWPSVRRVLRPHEEAGMWP